jgi:hypothetical protein
LPILTPAGLGRVNALFQLNPDPYATFCGSMKTLGIETIFAAQSKNKNFWRNQPFEKISLKKYLCKKQGDFLDHFLLRT